MNDKPAARRRGLMDFIRIPFREAPLPSTFMIARAAISAALPFMRTLLTALFVDVALLAVRGEATPKDVMPALWGLTLLIVLEGLRALQSLADERLTTRMNEHFRAHMNEKCARLEYAHIEDAKTWDLIDRVMQDPAGRVREGFSNLLMLASSLVSLASMLALVMAHAPLAGGVLAAMMIPLVIVALRAGKKQYETDREAERHARRARYISRVLTEREGVEERTLFGTLKALDGLWHERFMKAWRMTRRQQIKRYVQIKGTGIITMCVAGVAGLSLLWPVQSGQVSVGMFAALVGALLTLAQDMSWSLPYSISEVAKHREALRDMDDFFALSETPDALSLPEMTQGFALERIEFRGVRFRYPGTERDILKGFSCVMEAGKHYAIVGLNGAGKTTITKLLTGLYDGYEGEILINGRERREYGQAELKALFAAACQDFARYEIPLIDGLTLGVDTDSETARQAVRDVGLGEAVDALPKGMETPLGKIYEGGHEFSGGQWQRVALARVLCRPAALRILDEPTAALDPMAESRIYALFGRVCAGFTTLLITHRLGAARLADQIIVLSDGQASEIGGHDALMARGGLYARMFESQRSWFE